MYIMVLHRLIPLIPPELRETLCRWPFGVVAGVARYDEPPVEWRNGKRKEPCKKCWPITVAPEAGGAG